MSIGIASGLVRAAAPECSDERSVALAEAPECSVEPLVAFGESSKNVGLERDEGRSDAAWSA